MEFSLLEELRELALSQWVLIGVALALVAALWIALVRMHRTRKEQAQPAPVQVKDTTRALVYGALCVALSFLLSYLKLFSMPQGGSITVASMLPLALYAYWFGLKQGLIAGVAVGILQCIQQPYVVHWAQFFLDYVFAFACFGLAGLFPRSLPLGLIVGGIGRILCSTLAGVIFFAEYAPAGMNVWAYSVGYNAGSLGPDVIICIVIALLPPMARVFERIRPR